MKRSRGFTLIEVVLAMTALALLMVLVYSAFFLAIRAVERGTNAVVAQQRLRASRDVLIRQIKSISVHPLIGEDDDPLFCLRGNATALTFITENPQGGGGGLARVIYTVRDDPPRLEMVEDPNIKTCDFEVSGQATEPVTLLDGFTKLEFRYQHNEDPGRDVNSWPREWDSLGEDPGGLPVAVAVVIDGIVGADVDVASQTLSVPIMAFVQDEALASEPDTVCELDPACRDELARAENGDDEEASDKNDKDDNDDEPADEDDHDDEKDD